MYLGFSIIHGFAYPLGFLEPLWLRGDYCMCFTRLFKSFIWSQPSHRLHWLYFIFSILCLLPSPPSTGSITGHFSIHSLPSLSPLSRLPPLFWPWQLPTPSSIESTALPNKAVRIADGPLKMMLRTQLCILDSLSEPSGSSGPVFAVHSLHWPS